MRNWPRYSRGSFEAEEITRPLRKKIFFSTPLLLTKSVPVFCPRLSHWSRSPGSIVFRLPLTLMMEEWAKGAGLYRRAELRPLSLRHDRGETLFRCGRSHRPQLRRRHRPRRTGSLPVHARPAGVDVPRQALDDAPIRRLLDRRGVEQALSLPSRARHNRTLGGVRSAHADRDGL